MKPVAYQVPMLAWPRGAPWRRRQKAITARGEARIFKCDSPAGRPAIRGSVRPTLAVSGGMKTKPLAFSVHLLTGSGAALALMALVAATQGNWRLMFGWLGIALIVDGIDGPLARKVDTKKNAANWDGVILDLVIDYLTYVFIPAYALIYAPLLPSPWGLIAALFIALTGVVYFADVRM